MAAGGGKGDRGGKPRRRGEPEDARSGTGSGRGESGHRGRTADPLERFARFARGADREKPLAAFIIDSPWMPGYAGCDALDFFFDDSAWIEAYEKVREDLPGTAFIPGAWPEFGMAAEPSGFGSRIAWNREGPPQIHPLAGGIEAVLGADPPDPEHDGLMPVALRRLERLAPRLEARGFPPRIAAARGPLAVAAHLAGVTELLTAVRLEPERCEALFSVTCDLCIAWLKSQLARMTDPIGILVLDDVSGMMSPVDAERLAVPFLKKVFGAFPAMIRIFHNDAPNKAVYPLLAGSGMEVFNFSHTVSIEEARKLVGPDIVLMGNIPPLDVLARGAPEAVRAAAEETLRAAGEHGPVVVSAGGGVSPGTPIANLKTLAAVVGT